MLKQACQDLSAAMEAGDWDRADRALQYFIGLIQRRGFGEGEAREIAAALDDLRIRTVCDHDIDQRMGPVQVVWMLAAVCSFVTQAARRSPQAAAARDLQTGQSA